MSSRLIYINRKRKRPPPRVESLKALDAIFYLRISVLSGTEIMRPEEVFRGGNYEYECWTPQK